MRIVILSRYSRLGASSRLRFFQYIPYLVSHGIEVSSSPLLGDDYVSGLYAGKVSHFNVLKSYLKRFGEIVRCGQHDLVWVEKEMLPWLPSWIELGLFPEVCH